MSEKLIKNDIRNIEKRKFVTKYRYSLFFVRKKIFFWV